MQLIKIGNRIINPAHVMHASYDPNASSPCLTGSWQECVVTFSGEEFEIFYNEEAERVWKYLSVVEPCFDITPTDEN